MFQAKEYDQILFSTISYVDPLDFGFENCTGGLKPKLNSNSNPESNAVSHITVSEIDPHLTLSADDDLNNYSCDDELLSDEDNDDHHMHVPQEYSSLLNEMPSINPATLTSSNIVNITLGQVDDFIDGW